MGERTRISATAAVAAAVVAFAAGLGAGWLLFAGDSEPHDAAPPARPVAAPSPDTAAAPPRHADERSARPDAAAERAVAAAVASRDDLPPLSGAGVIRGTVKSETGAPVASVAIRAYAYTPPEWNAEIKGRSWDEIPLDETLRRTVRQRRWWEASKKTAVTGADGTFELTGMADVNWSVSAHADGFTFATPHGGAEPARVGKDVEFVASQSIRFDVEVRLPDGTKPPRARLQWTRGGENGTTSAEWWPGRESTEMAPGRWRVSATGGDDDRFAAKDVDVDVHPGMDRVVLTLAARRGVVAVAKRPDGFATMPVRFFLRRADGTEPTDDELRAAQAAERRWVFDDAPGPDRRADLDLERGAWTVAAGLDGGALARRTVTVADGVVDCELAVPAPDLSQFVEVRVAAPDGTLVAAANVYWQYRATSERASYGTTTIPRGTGVWLLRRVGPGDRPQSSSRSGAHDPNGRWFVTVSADGFGPEETEAAPGAARVDVRLETPAVALVRVTGLPAGVDVTHVMASVSTDADGSVGKGLGADGSARVAPVKPGSREVRLSIQIGEWSSVVFARRTVDLAAGDNSVEIAAPRLYPLDLDLGASQAHETRFMERVADDDSTESIVVQLDAAGRTKIPLLPAGRYRLDVDGKQHEFRVPETRTFKLP